MCAGRATTTAAYSGARLDVRAPTGIGTGAARMRRATDAFRAAAVATASFATARWVALAHAEPSASTSASSSSAPTAGSNARDVTPLDAPIAAAYPTAANKSTAQWRVYTDIGRDLSARGRMDEAGRYLRRALAEAKAGFGDDDPHVAAARNNLAELYRLQRRWDEAEALYTQAAAALERHYGPGHPAAATATHNLAGCKLARGDHRGAYAAYAAAAKKKAASLGKAHPDYAATLFHMAEAKRAGGDGASAVTLLEESVRVLDAVGQGESSAACRRLERLAQAQGDLCGDHVAAEATRRRVLEAREHAATASTRGDGTGAGRRGFFGAAAASHHLAAVAAAAEAHASSLAELGRWNEAMRAMRRAVEANERRAEWTGANASANANANARGWRSGGDYGPRTFVDAVANAATAVRSAVFGDGGERAAAESAAANVALQLASSRVRLADVSTRAAAAGDADATSPSAAEERIAHLRVAFASLQPAAESAAAALSAAARETRDGAGTVRADVVNADMANADAAGSSADASDRSVAAEIRRREAQAAPERHVASLVLFGRAARALLVETGENESAREAAVMHVGDAVEWLHAGARASDLAAEADAAGNDGGGGRSSAAREAGRRAMSRELRECRAAAERARVVVH